MNEGWREMEPTGPEVSGDVGGDEQVSEAWGRRFALPRREDGLYPLLTISVYVADENAVTISEPGGGRHLVLRRQDELMVCRDPEDPGSTEEWCGYRYSTLPFNGVPAEKDAKRACAELPTPTLAYWDGAERHWAER